jgi:hypothetical protein
MDYSIFILSRFRRADFGAGTTVFSCSSELPSDGSSGRTLDLLAVASSSVTRPFVILSRKGQSCALPRTHDGRHPEMKR